MLPVGCVLLDHHKIAVAEIDNAHLSWVHDKRLREGGNASGPSVDAVSSTNHTSLLIPPLSLPIDLTKKRLLQGTRRWIPVPHPRPGKGNETCPIRVSICFGDE